MGSRVRSAVILALATGCGGSTTSATGGGGGRDAASASSSGIDSGRASSGGSAGLAGASFGGSAGSAFETGGSATSSDAGSITLLPPVDAGTDAEKASACQHAFAVSESTRCGGFAFPPSEVQRLSALYQRDCMNQFSMPGNGVTAAALEACAAATEAGPCDLPNGPPPECDFRGILLGGAPCFQNTQCQSGFCPTQDISPGGPGPLHCGQCRPIAKVGEACPDSSCPGGSLCISTDSSSSSYTCVALSIGVENAPCDELTKLCEVGLYCDGATLSCVPLRGLGEQCGSQWATGCKPPLHCTGAPGVCMGPGAVGDACQADTHCNAGVVCDFAAGHCAEVVWTDPGAPCDSGVHRCRSGTCAYLGFHAPEGGVCPVIVPEGGSCDEGAYACDEGLVCFGGVCKGAHSVACP